MNTRWLTPIFGLICISCAPAELSGSDRIEGGSAESAAPTDASHDGETAPPQEAGGDTNDLDSNEPPAKDGGPEASADGCPAVTTANDFYVVPSGDAGVCNGFSTIGTALQAARSSTGAQRTVHLAAGIYSDSTEFPIDLRGGISLVGNGEGSTILKGGALTTILPPANAYTQLSASSTVSATILTGDAEQASRIADLSIQPPPGGMAGTEAIVCDRGNATTTPPAPNTVVSNVEITGFEVGVRVTWSSPPLSGCNLSLTSSIVQEGWFGVVADGYDSTSGPIQAVSMQVGGSAGEGNQFIDIHIPSSDPTTDPRYLNGAAVATCDAVTGAGIKGNQFFQQTGAACDMGIWAVHTGAYESPGLDIENNGFGPLTNAGIFLWGPVIADQLLDNDFHDISMPTLPKPHNFSGSGLSISADVSNVASPFAVVRRARGNSFFGNDVGVEIRSYVTPLPQDPGLITDFGTATDPGNNTFRCNSEPPGMSGQGQGSDIFVFFMTPSAGVVPFEGNVWDHVPPTTTTGLSVDRGTDVWIAPGSPTLDTADASTTSMPPCPVDRVTGP